MKTAHRHVPAPAPKPAPRPLRARQRAPLRLLWVTLLALPAPAPLAACGGLLEGPRSDAVAHIDGGDTSAQGPVSEVGPAQDIGASLTDTEPGPVGRDADVPTDAPNGIDAADSGPEDVGPPPECGPGARSPLPDPCNDFQPCTIDACEDGVCVHTPDPACCTADDQCDDGIDCTADTCNLILHTCMSVRDSSFCCVNGDDCDDGDACTDDVCAAHRCVFPPIPACADVTVCVDQNECTEDATVPSPAGPVCVFTPVAAQGAAPPGCCAAAADCDDADAATLDVCTFARCDHLPLPCQDDGDCAGSGDCTSGTCESGQCVYPAACCEAAIECDDGVALTQDTCIDHQCAHTVDAAATCGADGDCAAPTTCAVESCVGGQCSVAVAVDAPGCCATDADCAPSAAACTATACQDFTCVEVPSSAPWTVASETFPGAEALAAWTITDDGSGARWQWAPSEAKSPPGLLYYGALPAQTIDVGTTKGTAVSPPISLPQGTPTDGLMVRFWRRLAVEPISSRDVVTLEVVPASGPPVQVWDKSYDAGPGLGWRLDEVALPGGLVFPIQLRWSFDTIDAVNNDYAGVFIDDVELLRPCP